MQKPNQPAEISSLKLNQRQGNIYPSVARKFTKVEGKRAWAYGTKSFVDEPLGLDRRTASVRVEGLRVILKINLAVK